MIAKFSLSLQYHISLLAPVVWVKGQTCTVASELHVMGSLSNGHLPKRPTKLWRLLF